MKTYRLALILLLAGSLLAQSEPGATTKKRQKSSAAAPSAEVQELKAMLEQQQQAIQSLTQSLQTRDAAIQQLQQQMAAVQAAAERANSKAEGAVTLADYSAMRNDVSDLKMNVTNVALSVQEGQKHADESPLALHYKGVTLTPGGFLAAESVWRQKATASDVNTPFSSIPFQGADAAHLSEWFGSGRQSRITLLAEGKLSNMKLAGYYETDWLSAGITSNNNQSNSYTNRQRQLWGQAALSNGWTFTGGQMWSLVTETKKGLDNRTEALPMTIDAQYHVGFSWTRQFGFRVTKNFDNKVWLGFSVENPQTTIGGRGFPASFLAGNVGAGGGLYNPTALYSFNETPDFVVKAAFEPGFGHYEVFGIVGTFRDRVYPAAPATPFNDTRTAGGAGANARWSVMQKHVDIGVHVLGGDGVGRYGTSTLADATVRPNGTLAPIRAAQALGTLEWHSPHWDIYTNAGVEYAQRTVYTNAAGTALLGYGPGSGNTSACNTEATPSAPAGGIYPPNSTGFNPASGGCPVDTRDLIEGTFGFWYKVYNGPKGRLQFGPQYSYLVKNVWGCDVTHAPGLCPANSRFNPHAVENMFFTSFRYYLP